MGLSNVAARDIAHDPRRERPILEGMMAYRRAAGVVLALALFGFALSCSKSEPERGVLILVGMVLLFTEPAALDPVFQVRQAQGGPALLNLFGGLLVLGGSFFFHHWTIAGAAFALLLVVREAILAAVHESPGGAASGLSSSARLSRTALKAFVGPALIFGLASLVYTDLLQLRCLLRACACAGETNSARTRQPFGRSIRCFCCRGC